MKTKKITIKAVKEAIKEVKHEDNTVSLIDLTNYLYSIDEIEFEFVERNSNFDYWIEAQTGINLDNKFIGIIFDYNVKIDEYYMADSDEDFDSIFILIEDYNNKALNIAHKLNKANKN